MDCGFGLPLTVNQRPQFSFETHRFFNLKFKLKATEYERKIQSNRLPLRSEHRHLCLLVRTNEIDYDQILQFHVEHRLFRSTDPFLHNQLLRLNCNLESFEMPRTCLINCLNEIFFSSFIRKIYGQHLIKWYFWIRFHTKIRPLQILLEIVVQKSCLSLLEECRGKVLDLWCIRT